jgi:hypothetical protein
MFKQALPRLLAYDEVALVAVVPQAPSHRGKLPQTNVHAPHRKSLLRFVSTIHHNHTVCASTGFTVIRQIPTRGRGYGSAFTDREKRIPYLGGTRSDRGHRDHDAWSRVRVFSREH